MVIGPSGHWGMTLTGIVDPVEVVWQNPGSHHDVKERLPDVYQCLEGNYLPFVHFLFPLERRVVYWMWL